jgi:hypothetical protein
VERISARRSGRARPGAAEQAGERGEAFAFCDYLAGKTGAYLTSSVQGYMVGDFDKIVSGTVKKAEVGQLCCRIAPIGDGTAHVGGGIGSATFNGSVEGLAQ